MSKLRNKLFFVFSGKVSKSRLILNRDIYAKYMPNIRSIVVVNRVYPYFHWLFFTKKNSKTVLFYRFMAQGFDITKEWMWTYVFF